MSRYQVGNRAMGAVQVFNGTAAAIAGSALAGTGLKSALGGLMLGWGADNAAAGTLTAFNGQLTPTFGAQALQQAGISPEVVGAIYDLAGVAGAARLVKSGINPANVVDEVVNSSSKNAGAYNVADTARLRTQLISQEISSGHGFEKHVLQQGEFSSLGIKTRQKYASHIEDVLHNPSSVRYTVDGRVFYLQESTGTVVRNPRASDGGTAFQPRDWNDYIAQLTSRTEPY